MKKNCKTCQYFRTVKVEAPKMPDAPWCSNSKSGHHMQSVTEEDGCTEWEKIVRQNLDKTLKMHLNKGR
jgi:hypothetical protein